MAGQILGRRLIRSLGAAVIATAVGAAVGAVVGAGPAGAAAAATAACEIRYNMVPEETDYLSFVTIANVGEVGIYGWTLRFPVPEGQDVTFSFLATYEVVDGVVVANNLPDNGDLPPGDALLVVFGGTYADEPAVPEWFSVNGITCSVRV